MHPVPPRSLPACQVGTRQGTRNPDHKHFCASPPKTRAFSASSTPRAHSHSPPRPYVACRGCGPQAQHGRWCTAPSTRTCIARCPIQGAAPPRMWGASMRHLSRARHPGPQGGWERSGRSSVSLPIRPQHGALLQSHRRSHIAKRHFLTPSTSHAAGPTTQTETALNANAMGGPPVGITVAQNPCRPQQRHRQGHRVVAASAVHHATQKLAAVASDSRRRCGARPTWPSTPPAPRLSTRWRTRGGLQWR